jgi:hypothetical protein
MGKLERLQDVDRFHGFGPSVQVRPVVGDPWAVVLTLRRRRKEEGDLLTSNRATDISESS